MWIFIVSTTMIFGGLTSAYIVARSFLPPGKQVIFDLPMILWQNTAIIILSSITMQYGVWAAKRDQDRNSLFALLLTLVLGIVFLVGQVYGWSEMVASGLPLVNQNRIDSSVSFFYVFTGLHGVHIVAMLFAVLWVLAKMALGRFKLNRKSLSVELLAMFWHFLGFLWLYLFVFMLVTQR